MKRVDVVARIFCFKNFHYWWHSIIVSVSALLTPIPCVSLSNHGLRPALFPCGQFVIIIAHYHKTAAPDQYGPDRSSFTSSKPMQKSRQALSVSRGRLAGSF